MTFKKGTIPNPEGAGAKKNQQKRVARELLSPLVEKSVEEIKHQLEHGEADDKKWAVEMVMSYYLGKPKQEIDLAADAALSKIILQLNK